MTKTNADFIRRELGVVNDLEIARILALQPSDAEVLEARAWLVDDDDAIVEFREPSTGKVEQIVELVRAALRQEDDEPDLP